VGVAESTAGSDSSGFSQRVEGIRMKWDEKRYRIQEIPSRAYDSVYLVQKKWLFWWFTMSFAGAYDGYALAASFHLYSHAESFLLRAIAKGKTPLFLGG
jgi:hypothetical protein